MRRWVNVAVLAAVLVGATPVAAGAAPSDRITVVKAAMAGGQEVPNPVATDGFGRAVFVIDHDRQIVRYAVIAARIDEVTESHVHIGSTGVNGPPVAFLFDYDGVPLNIGTATEGTSHGFSATGVITAADLLGTVPGLTMAGFIEALESGNAYVNVHTLDFVPGEIRGQIG